jgi:enterochelin esterase-like enzyme
MDLVSAKALAILGTATGLSILVLVAAKLRGLRWRWFLPALLLPVALGLATAADAVNAYYQYLPTAGDVMQAATGDRQWPHLDTVLRLPTTAAERKYPRGVTVKMPMPADPLDGFHSTTAIGYLPPQYFADAAQRFPVVYLFHGTPGKPADWFHGGRAGRAGQQAASVGEPAIIVAPQMSKAWTDDPECVDGVHERVESHLLDDVIPTVDRTLRTQADRDGRVFAGMSAGGYCALNLALRHRDVVSSIIDMSGFTIPTHTGGMTALFGSNASVRDRLAAANSPADYASALTTGPPMRIWLDCGDADHEVLREMDSILPALQGDGFQVGLHTRPGGHTYEVWRPAFAEALLWAVQPA